MFGRHRRPRSARSTPAAPAAPAVPPTTPTDDERQQEFHMRSEPIPTRPVRTVLVDVASDRPLGFWDAPLWMPVGGVVEGGADLWEIVSVRLRLPTASPDEGVRPVLYLYARKAEA
jgi:hypothetical protein